MHIKCMQTELVSLNGDGLLCSLLQLRSTAVKWRRATMFPGAACHAAAMQARYSSAWAHQPVFTQASGQPADHKDMHPNTNDLSP